jgi:cysteinyl-tRNA synthetase
MDNDLDVKTAFNKLFKTVDRLNRMSKQGKLSSEDAQKTITALRKIDAVLQVIF